jgi:hydroxymethylpyrimidine pyrophosphatase-like HAD family hydrolase
MNNNTIINSSFYFEILNLKISKENKILTLSKLLNIEKKEILDILYYPNIFQY